MPLKEPKYLSNQILLKVFGTGDNKKIKIIHFKVLRNSGIEDDEEIRTPKGEANDKKLYENISRARSKIFEYSFCNEWDYFFTGTLDNTKYDRTDLENYHQDLTLFFRHYRRNDGCELKFLIVPELHSDGQAWHTHGFIKGLPDKYLHQFQLGDRMSAYIAQKVRRGEVVYDWPAYSRKFGFCDLEPIANKEAVSKYVTKYMNKSLFDTVLDVGAHLYYHSRGLQTSQLIRKGVQTADLSDIHIDYENDYCKVAWLPYSDELLERLKNSIGVDSCEFGNSVSSVLFGCDV